MPKRYEIYKIWVVVVGSTLNNVFVFNFSKNKYTYKKLNWILLAAGRKFDVLKGIFNILFLSFGCQQKKSDTFPPRTSLTTTFLPSSFAHRLNRLLCIYFFIKLCGPNSSRKIKKKNERNKETTAVQSSSLSHLID
jgi:uncharacterized membrane protein YciS (DUF1049 family)